MTASRTALFPGTFDPFTNGHLDLTRRAARLFDRVVVAVADSTSKGTLFSLAERAEMIRTSVRGMKHVEVVTFDDLVVECARREGALVLIRGLRAVSDFEFEFQMALMNRRLSRHLEVAFLMPSQEYTYLNSTLVREIARLGGDISGLVPVTVERRLHAKLRERAAAGVNGRKPSVSPARKPRASNVRARRAAALRGRRAGS